MGGVWEEEGRRRVGGGKEMYSRRSMGGGGEEERRRSMVGGVWEEEGRRGEGGEEQGRSRGGAGALLNHGVTVIFSYFAVIFHCQILPKFQISDSISLIKGTHCIPHCKQAMMSGYNVCL